MFKAAELGYAATIKRYLRRNPALLYCTDGVRARAFMITSSLSSAVRALSHLNKCFRVPPDDARVSVWCCCAL